jgi:hypothetical protein
MSELFKVDVAELSGTHIKLNLETVHPHAGPFGTDDVFALRLLHNQAFDFDEHLNYEATSPLGEAVTYDQQEDTEWARENASRFIASVKVEPSDLPSQVPTGTTAVYDIEVTDPKWLEHLEAGQTWDSAAYS